MANSAQKGTTTKRPQTYAQAIGSTQPAQTYAQAVNTAQKGTAPAKNMTQVTKQEQTYTPGYTGTYWEDIFADQTNDYNARAWIPGSGWTGVTVKDGKTVTTGLADYPGTLVETESGIYKITGTNPDGSYISEKYTGAVPKTATDYSIYADMYKNGYNSGSIGKMVQDQKNGNAGWGSGQQKATYIDANGEKQTGYVQGSSYLDSMLEMLNKQYQEQIAANDTASAAATQQAILQLENQKNSLNREYENLYEQLYLNRRMNEKALPEQLAAMGHTGGLTESSLLELQNEYQQNLRAGEIARLQGLGEIDTAITDTKLTGDLEKAKNAQQMAQNYYENYAQVMAALQAQENADREYRYQILQQQMQQELLDKQTAAENGWVLLENGILPGDAMLNAMGLSKADAQALLSGTQEQTYQAYYTPQIVSGVDDKWTNTAIKQLQQGGETAAGHWLKLAVQTGKLTTAQAQNVANYLDTL